MKKRDKILEIVLVILLTICGIAIAGYIVRPTDTDEAYTQVKTFHKLPENSVEVMIYGSSHAFRGVDPMFMYEKYGIGAYNYAWHWQRINTTRLFMEDSFDTQTPKVALIECYLVYDVLEDTDITAEIYYSRYIENKKAVSKYLEQCFSNKFERYFSYYVPLYAFHANWSNITLQSFQRLKVGSEMMKTMGFCPSDEVREAVLWNYKSFKQDKLSEQAIAVLDDIVKQCNEKGTEIVFFTVPYEGEYRYSDAMKEYAKQHDCAYLDLFEKNDEVGLNGKTDFSDFGHLNKFGAEKVADYLGKYLIEKYDLSDMRKVENNIWQQQN